jgi:hypothetical protein
MRAWNKVFCIGLSKTGTYSLDAAFALLGLRAVHYPSAEEMLAGRFGVLADFDAASDITVSLFYRELDAAYPGSLFVLTTRDLEPWLESIRAHLARRDSKEYTERTPAAMVRERMYGRARFDHGLYTEAFHRHHEGVRAYFRGRTHDLLTVNICEGEGWDRLCPFLGMVAPVAPFPHRHKRPVVSTEPIPVSVPSLRASTHPTESRGR